MRQDGMPDNKNTDGVEQSLESTIAPTWVSVGQAIQAAIEHFREAFAPLVKALETHGPQWMAAYEAYQALPPKEKEVAFGAFFCDLASSTAQWKLKSYELFQAAELVLEKDDDTLRPIAIMLMAMALEDAYKAAIMVKLPDGTVEKLKRVGKRGHKLHALAHDAIGLAENSPEYEELRQISDYITIWGRYSTDTRADGMARAIRRKWESKFDQWLETASVEDLKAYFMDRIVQAFVSCGEAI